MPSRVFLGRKTMFAKEHEAMFADIPVGGTVVHWWARQDPRLLDAAARKIAQHRANPWVFAGDATHFFQFARSRELEALQAMTSDEQEALLAWTEQ
jgi:hypothetical protein